MHYRPSLKHLHCSSCRSPCLRRKSTSTDPCSVVRSTALCPRLPIAISSKIKIATWPWNQGVIIERGEKPAPSDRKRDRPAPDLVAVEVEGGRARGILWGEVDRNWKYWFFLSWTNHSDPDRVQWICQANVTRVEGEGREKEWEQ